MKIEREREREREKKTSESRETTAGPLNKEQWSEGWPDSSWWRDTMNKEPDEPFSSSIKEAATPIKVNFQCTKTKWKKKTNPKRPTFAVENRLNQVIPSKTKLKPSWNPMKPIKTH